MEGESKLNDKNLSTDILYKIEVPANRYDLVCLEGLVVALKTYLGLSPMPNYTVKPSGERVIIKNSTEKIRPHIVCAILRDITFTEESLIRLIDLQDKLHGTICKY